MRTSRNRLEKYAAKVHGEVLTSQVPNFTQAMGRQLEVELYIKRLGLPVAQQHFYMDFGKGITKILKTHKAVTAYNEVCYLRNHWEDRGLDGATLDQIIAHFGLPACPVPPTCAWVYKKTLTFTGNVSAIDLDDFPVLVKLTNANFNFAHAQANGEDIRFMDSDTCPTDGTPLKHEIEQWDNVAQQARVWVKVPKISTGAADFIYMYYGNGAVADGQDAANVWNANYKMVQHMYDNPNTSAVLGSTSNAYVGTKRAANEPIEADAQIYKGQEYDGANDYVGLPNNQFGTASHSFLALEAYVTVLSGHPAYPQIINVVDSGITWSLYSLGLWSTTDRVRMQFRTTAGTDKECYADVGDSLSYDTLYHVVGVFDGQYIRIYINGDEKTQCFTDTNTTKAMPSTLASIGSNAQKNGGYWKGKIDEVRVSFGDYGDDWIMAQYLSMTDALITYGAEEAG